MFHKVYTQYFETYNYKKGLVLVIGEKTTCQLSGVPPNESKWKDFLEEPA